MRFGGAGAFASLALVAAVCAGCSGTGPVTVAVSPTTATLTIGQTQQLSAIVTGAEDTAVIWSVSGGTLASSTGTPVTYTAPNTPGTYSATATSVADPTQSATATITVSEVTVVVTPSTITLAQGATQQFTAMVSGTQNTAVTWSVNGGTLASSTGTPVTYTAPNTPGTYSATATSVADPTQSATATITVSEVTVVVTPPTITLAQGATQQFTAMVSGTQNTAVTWTASAGALDSPSGNPVTYTAPTDAGIYTVTATNVGDASGSGTATVTVEPTFAVISSGPGRTPFISFVELSAPSLGSLQSVGYVVQPKPGSVSKPVSVTYTLERLQSRGYVSGSTITLPVFGLYAGFSNSLDIKLQFNGQFSQTLPFEIATAPYADPAESTIARTFSSPGRPGALSDSTSSR